MKLRQLSGRFAKSACLISVSLISLVPAFAVEACPPANPNADFLTNFNIPCYAIPLNQGGGLNFSGDSNAIYDTIDYMVNPAYELVLAGTYPNARFLSVTVYDEHLAITSSIIDQSIPPLTSSMMNPYQVGATFQPGQRYGLTIGFGGTLTATPGPGCSASDTTIDQTVLDASQIHSGLTWLGYPNLPQGFPIHQTGANASGSLMVRKYISIPAGANSPETVIVRQILDGCAIPAKEAIQMGILSLKAGMNSSVYFNTQQIQAHQQFSNTIEQLQCYKPDPNNAKQWFRSVDYVPIANLVASLDLNLTSSNLAPVVAGTNFIRLRFPVPTTPTIPCSAGGCSLTGNEDMRYYSVSFLGASTQDGKTTLTSVGDTAFTPAVDPNGNVTLLVGMGPTAPPSFVTAANYYVYLDLTKITNYNSLSRIEIRHLLPNSAFSCSNANVPLFTMEYNNVGGFMGQYVPTVDFPTLADLTAPAPPPPTRANTCEASGVGIPQACGPSQ